MEKGKQPKDRYRLVIFSESTFEEIYSYNYRPWHLYVVLITLTLIITSIIIGLMVLTPLGSLLGNNRAESDELIRLRQQILAMEENAKSHDLYIRNLRQLLSGEPVIDSVINTNPTLDSIVTVNRILEDELLRKETDLDLQLNTNNYRKLASNPARPLDQLHLLPPLPGKISLGFDPGKNHLGVDINAPANTAVKAIQDGYIISAGWNLETGNTIGIQHQGNMISFYKHNSALLKKTNSFVRAGEAVAIIGNTGTLSTGPHLHFELWINGKPVDPTRYINFN